MSASFYGRGASECVLLRMVTNQCMIVNHVACGRIGKKYKKYNMKTKRIRLNGLLCVAPLLALTMQSASAQEMVADGNQSVLSYPQFGSPDSVPSQLDEDQRVRKSLTEFDIHQPYLDWKECLRDQHGFSFTLDYTAGIVGATKTIGNTDYGSSGAVRFYGSWDLIGRESGNTGTFVWKVENRHRYSKVPSSGMAAEVGYAGANFPSLSNIGSRLTNLYWKQKFKEGRVEVIGGMLDATDWVDVYALASPWTGFSNFAFATGGAAMPIPDDATLGMYVNAMLTDNLYMGAGFTDANADSTDPFNGFDTFFNDNEYFKTIELGWTTSQDRFYLDNTHLTYWHVDERKDAGVASGWGLNFSYAHSFDERWMPFFRAGYADEGGSILQKTVSAGLGYHLCDDISLLGLGVNWGEINEDTYGRGLDDQYVIELFTRFQVTKNFELTPDVQVIFNPALNPDVDHSVIYGLRGRMVF